MQPMNDKFLTLALAISENEMQPEKWKKTYVIIIDMEPTNDCRRPAKNDKDDPLPKVGLILAAI